MFAAVKLQCGEIFFEGTLLFSYCFVWKLKEKCNGKNAGKGVSDLEPCKEYFALSGRSCEIFNFPSYSVDSIKRTVLLKVLLLNKTSKNIY